MLVPAEGYRLTAEVILQDKEKNYSFADWYETGTKGATQLISFDHKEMQYGLPSQLQILNRPQPSALVHSMFIGWLVAHCDARRPSMVCTIS